MIRTIQALKASAKKNSSHSVTRPRASTCCNRPTPKTRSRAKAATLTRAICRCERSSRQVTPASAGTAKMEVKPPTLSSQLPEFVDVHGGESLPNPVNENTQDHDRHHDVKEDAQF